MLVTPDTKDRQLRFQLSNSKDGAMFQPSRDRDGVFELTAANICSSRLRGMPVPPCPVMRSHRPSRDVSGSPPPSHTVIV